jgi:hypothetical protein
MKKISSVVFLLALISCHPEKSTGPFPVHFVADRDLIIYEGAISLRGEVLSIELGLKAERTNENSFYRLSALSSEHNSYITGWAGNGTYTILSANDRERFIQLHKVTYSQFTGRGKMPRQETMDLTFRISSDYELILVDDDFDEITPLQKLTRRSNLFTVEGYFTVSGDTTDFFEQNTREYWPVSNLGFYDEAVLKYGELATEKYEGIYLRALAYSVHNIAADGKEREALVFKKILKMGSDNL